MVGFEGVMWLVFGFWVVRGRRGNGGFFWEGVGGGLRLSGLM
jgi:hypothetical protein